MMNKRTTGIPLLVLLAACGATGEVTQETEAVRDFIAAADLQEVKSIRAGRQAGHTYLSDYFVTVKGDRGYYLAEFKRRCSELKRTDFTPAMVDHRRDANQLHAKFDTIRGCYIDKLYELTPDQAQELKNLGDCAGRRDIPARGRRFLGAGAAGNPPWAQQSKVTTRAASRPQRKEGKSVKYQLLGAAALLSLVACGQQQSEPAAATEAGPGTNPGVRHQYR